MPKVTHPHLPPKGPALERWENEGGNLPIPKELPRVLTKKLVIFDLDGTLAESKSSVDSEMVELLTSLMSLVKVAVISGGDWPQFQLQLLSKLPETDDLLSLSLLPTSGTKFYEYRSGWHLLYSEILNAEERKKILSTLEQVVEASGFEALTVWGEVMEDRGSQITYSALGQQAPNSAKTKWDPDFKKRTVIKAKLDVLLPNYSIRMGGTTSIDVTKSGIDKAYGIRKLRDRLGIRIQEMVFVGDALFPGGNDYPARETGVECIQVRDPEECKGVFRDLIARLRCVG